MTDKRHPRANDWPMLSPALRDLHGAWCACTQRERAEFMEAVGLVGKLDGPIGPQEKRDEAQESAAEVVHPD